MITHFLFGRFAYNPKNDDRCPWGLVWDRHDGAEMVRCCQKKRGHGGPHEAVFEDDGLYVRIEWQTRGGDARDYFKRADDTEHMGDEFDKACLRSALRP